MRKKLLLLISTIIISSSLIINCSLSFAEVSSPRPLYTLLPGLCDAVIKPDFSFTNKLVFQGFEHVDSEGVFREANYTNELNGFYISCPGFLTRYVNLHIGKAANPIEMWAGDINQDNSINMSDIMIIASSFNTSSNSENYNAVCDFNKDYAINLTDVMIAAKHFGQTTKDYPEFDPRTTSMMR